MALGMLPLVAWMAFSTFYYGFPFPNTAYAKLSSGMPSSALMAQGCWYFWNSLRADPLTLTVIAAGMGIAVWQRKAGPVCIAAGILLYLFYILRIGGDFMSGRFFTAPLLAALVALAALDWRSPPAWLTAASVIVVLGCCSIRPLALNENGFDRVGMDRLNPVIAEHGICDERAYYFHATGLTRVLRSPQRSFHRFDWVQAGIWVKMAAQIRRERLAVEIGAIGFPGLLVGPQVDLIDLMGLADPLLARLPARPDPRWRIGHYVRLVPVGYVETVRTGKNCLREPHLAEYYDHLALIIRGNLWDWRRLAAIAAMNLGRYDGLLEPIGRQIRGTPPAKFQLLFKPTRSDLAEFSRAIQREPRNPLAYANRGVVYDLLHMNGEAIRDFGRAIGLDPRNATLCVRRGMLAARQDRLDAAIEDFDRAIKLDPNYPAAYTQRAAAWAKKGDLDRAVGNLDRAIALDPAEGDAYFARGILAQQRGDRRGAARDFVKYVALFPTQYDRFYHTVQALLETAQLRRAYELGAVEPKDPPAAMRDLAWVLATHPDPAYRDGAEAVIYAQLAIAASPTELAEFLDTLAAAYAEAGRFPEAVAAAQKALTLPTDGLQESLPEAIRGRLQLYQAHQAYHLSPAR
jgi:tetratricopeptide (TPR) repeat protein